MSRKIIALTGSTRGKKTASESMVNYLFDIIGDRDFLKVEKYRAHEIFNNSNKLDQFRREITKADILLISSPIYVHSLPYPLTVIMEEMARGMGDTLYNKELLTIIHSSYPGEIQRKAGYEICERFAEEMGMKWLGAIGFAGTALLEGRPIDELGRSAKWMKKALNEVGNSMIEGTEISEKARRMAGNFFSIPLPLRAIKIFLNFRVKFKMHKNNLDLYAQPIIDNSENTT